MGGEVRPEQRVSTIRAMTSPDTARVFQILGHSPEAVSWPEETIREVLGWQNTFALASEGEGSAELTGFLMGRQVASEAEILNLAVSKGSRRKGQGSALLVSVEEQLRARGVERVFLEVRESNTAGIAFYTKHGFRAIGRRARYYQKPQEAALVMEKRLDE